MQFHFDGLDEPIVLPDEYLKVRQYQRLRKALNVHDHLKDEDYFDYFRLCIADAFDYPDLIAKTDDLDMTPRNVEVWEKVEEHIMKLFNVATKVGDDETNEALNNPLAEAPTEPTTPSGTD